MAALVLALVTVLAPALTTPAAGVAAPPAVNIDPRDYGAGTIPEHFVGLSVEWSLIERYMSPTARPAFIALLKNLGTGVLRIGGSSQDLMPFDAAAPNTNQVITPEDLSYIRATLDGTNSPDAPTPDWGVSLGTAMAPVSATRPFISPDHARAFVTQGVEPAFSGAARRDVVGIGLGNEPDLTYGSSNLAGYLADLSTFSAPGVTGPFPIIAPNTSEDILPWQSIDGRTVPTRYFWNWPQILDTVAPEMKARAGAFAPYASDHFYPLARTCVNKPYRCPTTTTLLSDEHMNTLDYQAYVHAQEAARHGLGYRLDETNTAAARGADGVSNVAASATYALDFMFHNACPQPPNSPGANSGCTTGAIGLNFHNAEVRAFFYPEEGNAYYNAITYDPTAAFGAPTAAPLYYAMLLFSKFAQGSTGLRPVAVSTSTPSAVKAWRVQGTGGTRRLFLINKGDQQTTVSVGVPASNALVDRMTPYDPTGSGQTLAATQVRIDGRQVAADGSWPGFAPQQVQVKSHTMPITLAPGEAAVITIETD
ncbi:MAG: hypothetical protein ABI808_00405 [Pseudonocardiales bacterium]